MEPVRTTCPYCGVGCGVLAKAGEAVRGDPVHPANFGRLCSKGSALSETLSHEGRLLHPEINGVRVTWDAALDRVADAFRATIATHGPDSVALYVSGQLLTEDYYAANKLAKGFLGTANIDSNLRLCMASAVMGHRRAFGEDIVPGNYEDLEMADLLVLVGSNTAWCHPVLYQRIVAAKASRPGMRVVVIDPRRTATCEDADLHLALAPGSDVALFAGLLGYLRDLGCADLEFLADHAGDTAAALAVVPSLAEAAALCGLDEASLATFYRWFAATPRTVTMFSQGVNQSSAGSDKANAIINVHLFTGRIGQPGAGPFSVTGQPNAMGGREVGALANMLAGHLEWDRTDEVSALRTYWDAPNLAAGPGLKAVSLFEAIRDKRVRAVWVIATNPAVSLPAGAAVRAALAGCNFVTVSDCVRESDTMDLAHVRLPALGWGEKDGTVTNSERVISRQRAFLPMAGEARPDWWAVARVAHRLGYGAAFAWNGPAAIFREHAAMTGLVNAGRRVFDISGLAGMSDEEYATMPPTQWPCPANGSRPDRLFGSGGFTLPEGRARLVPTAFRAPANPATDEWPLVLMTGRIRDQWHTMTRTGKAARLLAHIPEPVLSVHPDDAAGMADGGLAEVSSAWGSAVLRLRHDPGLRRGTAFAPMHWTARFCPAARVNTTVNPAVDPYSGQPELKHTPVRVRAWTAAWHGFVLARDNLGTDLAPWCAVLPVGEGVWRHEIAGDEPAFVRLQALLHDGSEGWIALEDSAAGLHRAALVRNGSLIAVVFIGPDHMLPPREWLIWLFAEMLTPVTRRSILAGRPADGRVADPHVCVCHGIGEVAILRSAAEGCGTVEAVGRATRAGTNCGSCRPEIRALLTRVLEQV